ncbi:MAG: helix-turn-helix domain-containing protein, partial [Chloroflexota bacterium]|nr:helix-turn-helix domain-containing protein [Chloroflexota bacterium]
MPDGMGPDVLRATDPAELGRRLQEARRARGRTQQEAADFLNAARTTITAIEKGQRRVQPSELARLATFYGRSVGELLRAGEAIEAFSVQLRASLAADDAIEQEVAPFTWEFQR